MKAILFLLFILSALSLRAELAIYNFTGSLTIIGGGSSTTVRPKGVLLWDVDTGEAYQVGVFKLGPIKRLIVADLSGSRFFQAAGSRGRSYTAVTTEGMSFTFGRNAVLRLRPGRDILLPRTAKNTAFNVDESSGDGLTYMGPASGVYSFSARQSATANTGGLSLSEAVDNARNKYLAQGYTE